MENSNGVNQKIATWVGTIVIIIIATTAGVFVWLSQKNDPVETSMQIVAPKKVTDKTAGWKTYTNSEFGYELKYPADFGAPEGPALSNNPAASTSQQNPGLDFQVQFFLKAFGPINSLEDAFKISTRGNGFQERLKKEITFNDTRAIEYAGVNNARNVHALVGVLNGKYFDLVVESKNSPAEADALFQKLLVNLKDTNDADTRLVPKSTN